MCCYSATTVCGRPEVPGNSRSSRSAITISPEEIVKVFRVDKRAAADFYERELAVLDQRVERGGADAAELVVPGFLDRHEVPHMFLVAPRA